ncbi:MAG: tRNA (adenosine(37)-N6)-dimethylallyltransferase MiaA [Actinomycetaceae bacterium]|nr:tRNA (adenosine(37)-N6)-dimethylallyltransferase MiaA [Actinomycetaceae bacterium]
MIGIVGPSASGKSTVAFTLAQRAQQWSDGAGEIVSMDAFALYRGMDIGTAKPPASQRNAIAHHQIDVLDISQVASVARYQQAARGDVDAIEKRGNTPIAVGGSGLYARALFDRMEFPGTDPLVRERLMREAESEGAEALYERLRQVDPRAANAVHPNNTRRVVRALEVIEITGKPFTATLPSYEFARPAFLIGIRRDNDDLDARIERRTEAMFAEGFVDEVRHLMAQGLEHAPTASRATGYPSVINFIRGRCSEREAREDVCLQTRRLVRRQIKWFRRDPRIHWVDATGYDDTQVADEAVRLTEMMR